MGRSGRWWWWCGRMHPGQAVGRVPVADAPPPDLVEQLARAALRAALPSTWCRSTSSRWGLSHHPQRQDRRKALPAPAAAANSLDVRCPHATFRERAKNRDPLRSAGTAQRGARRRLLRPGGHSLWRCEIVSAINQQFGTSLPVRILLAREHARSSHARSICERTASRSGTRALADPGPIQQRVRDATILPSRPTSMLSATPSSHDTWARSSRSTDCRRRSRKIHRSISPNSSTRTSRGSTSKRCGRCSRAGRIT